MLENLLVLSVLLSVYLLWRDFPLLTVILLSVVRVGLCKQSQCLRFCIGLFLVVYLESLLVSVAWFIILTNGGMKTRMGSSTENSCHWWTNQYLPLGKNSFPCVVTKIYNINISLFFWLMAFDQSRGFLTCSCLWGSGLSFLMSLPDAVVCVVIWLAAVFNIHEVKKEAALFVQRQAPESVHGTALSLHPLISNAGVLLR